MVEPSDCEDDRPAASGQVVDVVAPVGEPVLVVLVVEGRDGVDDVVDDDVVVVDRWEVEVVDDEGVEELVVAPPWAAAGMKPTATAEAVASSADISTAKTSPMSDRGSPTGLIPLWRSSLGLASRSARVSSRPRSPTR